MTATISKGTLNLRFMQNAQRAEQELETESVETATNDESHWEVAREVRDMWGITSSEASSRSASPYSIELTNFFSLLLLTQRAARS